jgi:tripartite-type tricarboxylate transporter receptor subunit TctC
MEQIMLRLVVTALIGTLLAGTIAPAQDWPNRPIRIIVPGGLNSFEDSLASLVSSSKAHNYHFMIENHTGGRGMGGAQVIASSPPDGYTFGITHLSSLVHMPLIHAWNPYHPIDGFTHVAMLASAPMALVVSTSLGIKTVAEFIEHAKKSDKPLTFASAEVGSPEHLIGEAIAASINVKVAHVAHRSRNLEQVLNEVVERKLAFAVTPLRPASSLMPARGLTGLAVTASEPVPLARNLPTFKELGYDDLVLSNWYAMSGPARLPKEIVDALNRDLVAVATKSIASRLRERYMVTQAMSPEALKSFIETERERFAPVIKRAGVTSKDIL